MAYVRNPLEDEENNSQVVSLESGVVGGANASPAPGTTARGTNWTNLQQYLETNKGAGTEIANAALGETNKALNQSKAAIDDWATNKAGKQIADNTQKDVWSDKIKGKSSAELVQTFKDPTAFNAWKNLGNYWSDKKEASDLDGYSEARNANQTALDKINNANTWEGQQQSITDNYKKEAPRYTQGMGVLDTFVARGDAKDKFDEFKAKNANFGDKFASSIGAVNSRIAEAKQQGQQAQKSVMDALAERIKGIENDAIKRGESEQVTKQAEAISGVQSEAAKQTRRGLGAMTAQNAAQFVKQGGKVNPADFYSEADVEALNQLAGIDSDPLTSTYFKTQGAQASLPTIDQDALNQWINDHRLTGAGGVSQEAGTTAGADVNSDLAEIIARFDRERLRRG